MIQNPEEVLTVLQGAVKQVKRWRWMSMAGNVCTSMSFGSLLGYSIAYFILHKPVHWISVILPSISLAISLPLWINSIHRAKAWRAFIIHYSGLALSDNQNKAQHHAEHLAAAMQKIFPEKAEHYKNL